MYDFANVKDLKNHGKLLVSSNDDIENPSGFSKGYQLEKIIQVRLKQSRIVFDIKW